MLLVICTAATVKISSSGAVPRVHESKCFPADPRISTAAAGEMECVQWCVVTHYSFLLFLAEGGKVSDTMTLLPILVVAPRMTPDALNGVVAAALGFVLVGKCATPTFFSHCLFSVARRRWVTTEKWNLQLARLDLETLTCAAGCGLGSARRRGAVGPSPADSL